MKQCANEIKEKIALYYDGVLSSAEIAEIDEHVKNCKDCQEELELYRYILDELHLEENQESEVSLPSDFHTNVMNRIKQETISKKSNLRFTKFSPYANLAATFVLVLFLALIGFLQNGQFKEKSALVESSSLLTSSTNEENARMEVGMAAESTVTAEASEITNYSLTGIEEEASDEVSDEVSLKIAPEEKADTDSAREVIENLEVVEEEKVEAENDGGVFLILVAILLILLALVMIRIFYDKKKRLK